MRTRAIALLTLSLAVILTGSVAWYGGARGLLFLALYLLTLVPGLPLGWWLFGKRHAAGWVAGALTGYALTCIVLALAIRTGWANPAGYAVGWLVLTGATWGLTPRPERPLVELPGWTRRDAFAWLLVLHLVPLFITVPFAHVGAKDAAGNKQYRAYFIADFVWHMALTQEIARHDAPPSNPYMFDKPIHYYWTYFVVPAAMGGDPVAPVERVELALKVSATGTALLMLSTLFFASLVVSRRAWVAALVTALAFVGPSFEGIYALVDLMRQGAPLDSLRHTNIDAVSAWAFGGLRVDGLMRSMLYTPQHSLSFALGMLAVIAGAALSAPLTIAGRLVVASALGLSVIFNPFLGAAFALIYAAALVADVASARRGWSALFAHAIAGIPIGLGLAWCTWHSMAGSAGAHLTFGMIGPAAHSPMTTLFLSLGGLLIPALAGLVPWRGVAWRPWIPAVTGLIVGLALMYFVSLGPSDEFWVGFRAGNILLVTVPMLAARALVGLSSIGATGLGCAAVILTALAGAPTTMIDAYNAQDVASREVGPGFYWTTVITPNQQAGLNWIRKNTPATSVVQARRLPYDVSHVDLDRQNWSIVQSLAGRRSAASNVISLLPEPENVARSAMVEAMFTSQPPAAAYDAAKSLGIEYLWLDQEDGFRAAFLDRIAARHDLFYAVFHQGDVYVIRVG